MRQDNGRFRRLFTLALGTLLAAGAGVSAQTATPEGVERRSVDLWSDGTRLSGDLFAPKSLSAQGRLPGIVMSHGWGGVRSHLNQAYAPFIAAEGFVVLTIDYRGWGDSDSRLILRQEMPQLDDSGEATVRVQAIRELVDPFDQTEDIVSAIDFLAAEPSVDGDRIGLWGSSYSGGHVVWVAAHDPRVKAIVSQVGSMDSTGIVERQERFPDGLAGARRDAARRARGELPPVPQGVDVQPGLRGTPYLARMAHYSPVAVAHRVRAAALILDAGKEELFDIRENGQKVFEIVKESVPAKYHVFADTTHYGIYREKRPEALAMAIAWYKDHLREGE